MFAKFLIGAVSCPNCERGGELSRMLFYNPYYEGAAYVDGQRGNAVMEQRGGYIGTSIDASVICPVCDFTTTITIHLNFIELVIRLDGLGEVANG